MNTNPVNLGVRFLLEIAMLIVLGNWGWHQSVGWVQYLAAMGIPLIAAILWGVFRIQNDPKPAPVQVPGIVRLVLELGLFGFAIYALHDLGHDTLSLTMGLLVFLHYLVSYDRTWAMLRDKSYKGFVK